MPLAAGPGGGKQPPEGQLLSPLQVQPVCAAAGSGAPLLVQPSQARGRGGGKPAVCAIVMEDRAHLALRDELSSSLPGQLAAAGTCRLGETSAHSGPILQATAAAPPLPPPPRTPPPIPQALLSGKNRGMPAEATSSQLVPQQRLPCTTVSASSGAPPIPHLSGPGSRAGRRLGAECRQWGGGV